MARCSQYFCVLGGRESGQERQSFAEMGLSAASHFISL